MGRGKQGLALGRCAHAQVAIAGEGQRRARVWQKAGYCGIFPWAVGLQWPMIHHQQMELLKDSDKIK